MCAKDIDHDQLMKDLESKTEENDQLRALVVSQQQLLQALDPSNQALEQRLRQMGGAKKLADAEKESTQAQLDALKAKLGDFGKADYKGEVQLADGSGKMETEMLAACASARVSQIIGERVRHAIGEQDEADPVTSIAVYPGTSPPNFDDLLTFRAKTSVAESAMTAALDSSERNEVPGPGPKASLRGLDLDEIPLQEARLSAAAAPIAVAGMALETVDKLLSYLRSDYKAGSIAVTPHEESLLMEIARGLRKKTKAKISTPCLFAPCVRDVATSDVVTAISALATKRGEVDGKVRVLESRLTSVNKELEHASAREKQTLKDEANALQRSIDRLNKAGGLFDSLVEAIFRQSDGASLASVLLKQAESFDAFKETQSVLLVNLDHVGGSYYTKKSFFTTIGLGPRVPAYFSGGMSVSYALFRRADGSIIDAGTIPSVGGFACMDGIKDYIASRSTVSAI